MINQSRESQSPSPKCSLIINTYNRAHYLRRLLSGLQRLRDVDFEVIVVNGPSTDGTGSVLEGYEGRIKVVDCPTRNLSHSRNLGIAAAAGEIVVFIDDDALPEDEFWLARYAQAFHGDKCLTYAGSAVRLRDTCSFEFQSGLTSDYGLHIFDRNPSVQTLSGGIRWFQGLRGCNCAFRREALAEIGGFDEFFEYYLEESDVCLRLIRGGYSGTYLSDNPVRHYSAPSHNRKDRFNLNWHTITRSDTYFALKNGGDPPWIRIPKTLRLAPQKHFVKDIQTFLQSGEISLVQWLQLMGRWGRGLVSGLMAGLFKSRHLATFKATPPAFLPFGILTTNRSLRIALLSQTVPGQTNYGGIGRYVYDLALGLHERGHEVHIFCKDEQSVRWESLGFTIHGISATENAIDQNFGSWPILNKNLGHAQAIVRKLAALYAQGIQFDVVHATNWDAEGVALIRAEVYPVVLVPVTSLAQVSSTEEWPITEDLFACVAVEKWQIEQADSVCSPSVGVWKSYESLGVSADGLRSWRVVPLGIIPERAPSMAPKADSRRLLFVGRLERRKGAHVLFATLPSLLAECPEWECHIVGDDMIPMPDGGTFKESFLQKHSGASWLTRVYFHGVVAEDELRRHYQMCDLFVAPSLFESYGLIYHEAMQYSKAVVACRTGGVPEVMEHNVEGLLVAPGDQQELHQALSLLMRDEGLRTRMGRAGAERVHQRVNYRTMAAGMEHAYYDAIAAVGEEWRHRRVQLWPKGLPLFIPSKEVTIQGPWIARMAMNGQRYQCGQPGATIEFEMMAGSWVELNVLRHDWSGILEVSGGREWVRSLDLYQSDGYCEYSYRIELPVNGDAERMTITLRVLSERNPESLGCEVWLRQIAVPSTGSLISV